MLCVSLSCDSRRGQGLPCPSRGRSEQRSYAHFVIASEAKQSPTTLHTQAIRLPRHCVPRNDNHEGIVGARYSRPCILMMLAQRYLLQEEVDHEGDYNHTEADKEACGHGGAECILQRY